MVKISYDHFLITFCDNKESHVQLDTSKKTTK